MWLSRSLCFHAARYAARGVSSWPFAAGLSEPSGLSFSLPADNEPLGDMGGVLAPCTI